MEQQQTGDGYQTGVAVAVAIAKRNLPAASERNPKGTPKEKWRCPFYPDYCTVLGHKDARNKDCGMKEKSKEVWVSYGIETLVTSFLTELESVKRQICNKFSYKTSM